MFRMIALFAIPFLVLLAAHLIMSAGRTGSSAPKPVQPTKAEKSLTIAHRQALCSKVDSYIIDVDNKGEKAPMPLIEARVAVEEAPNDEILAYAYAHLEREWAMVSGEKTKQPKRLGK